VRVVADRDICIGAGMCSATAPDLFDQDDEDGRVVVLVVEPQPGRAEAARLAVDLCPSRALRYSQVQDRP
jgi:ferredoxin